MAWVIILVLILAIIFVLYLGDQADKKTFKSNNTKEIMSMNENLIEAIYDIGHFTLPYTDKELQKINSVLRAMACSDSLSGRKYMGLHNLLNTLKISSHRIAELKEQIASLNKDKVSNYIKLAKNDAKQKSIKQLIHKKGVIKLVFEGNPDYGICVLGTEKDIKKWVQDNHRICVKQINSLLESDLKFDFKNKMYECFQSDFYLDAIKYQIVNITLNPQDITLFERVLDPDESYDLEALHDKGCMHDDTTAKAVLNEIDKLLQRYLSNSDKVE